jgi:Family of unknown function (DUF6855)
MIVIRCEMENSAADYDVGDGVGERHLFDGFDAKVFGWGTGRDAGSKLAHGGNGAWIRIDAENFAMTEQVYQVAALPTPRVEDAHARSNASAQDLIEEIDVNRAELVDKGGHQDIRYYRKTMADKWTLKTPSGGSEFEAWRDEAADPPALVVQVGKTQLRYHLRAIDDLHAMLKAHGDWMELGSADEQKPAAEGTVEAWARSPKNPVGGWYGLKKGLRGRFAMYVPPVLKKLGLAEVEEKPRNNRMRAI